MSSQRDRAELFRSMHIPGNPITLVNVWDAASARIVESLGFKAIATTSAGIAFLEGYADGQVIGRDVMLAGVDRICRAVDVPVSADMEAGYGESVDDAIATAKGVIATGAVGLNFEDNSPGPGGMIDAQLQVERIRAIRRVGDDYGVPLVINARVDVFLYQLGDAAQRMHVALERGRLFRAAGADCIFFPGVTEADAIAQLVRDVGAPINVLANAKSPSLAELGRLGVARISLGSGPMLRAISAFRDHCRQVQETGSFATIPDALTHADLNALFE